MLSFSRAKSIKAHSKSIVMGGGSVLFPIDTSNIERLAEIITKVVIEAEQAAYDRGYDDAQSSMRSALGITENPNG